MLFPTFMNLEKVYDRVQMKGLWDVMRIYGVREHLLEIRSLYKDASASVSVNEELSDSFGVRVGVRWVCDVIVAVQYL